jgi:hypothetical protein
MTTVLTAAPDLAERERDTKRTRFVLTASLIGSVVLVVFALFAPGWVSASVWAVGLSLTFLIYALATRDALLLRFIALAFLAGWIELLPDAWLVSHTDSLVYDPNEPFVSKSPVYMPLSWTAVLVQVGYFGWLLSRKVPMYAAMLLVGVLGALIIPFYEFISIVGGWWSYRNVPMILGVPYYIIMAEGLLMMSVPLLFRAVEKAPLWLIPVLALLQGIIMWAAVWVAYSLLG